jgi:predicted transposase/invertase (TIGR01784 family)
MIYEARLKAQRDEYSRVQGALRKGWEEGLDKGRQEGLDKGRQEEKLGIARTLKALGDPVEKIAQVTGLSAEKIAAL